MAFTKAPSGWLGAGYTLAASVAGFTTNDNGGTKCLTELTDAEAHASSGDIRKIVFAFLEKLYAAWVAAGTAEQPTKMQVFRSVSEPSAGVIRKTYTIQIDTNVTAQEVEDEPT